MTDVKKNIETPQRKESPRGDGPIRQVECEPPESTQETDNRDMPSNFSAADSKNGGGKTGVGRGTHCQLPSQIREFQIQGETLLPKVRCLWLPHAPGLKDTGELAHIHIPFCECTQNVFRGCR